MDELLSKIQELLAHGVLNAKAEGSELDWPVLGELAKLLTWAVELRESTYAETATLLVARCEVMSAVMTYWRTLGPWVASGGVNGDNPLHGIMVSSHQELCRAVESFDKIRNGGGL